jgi:hypothetical protein
MEMNAAGVQAGVAGGKPFSIDMDALRATTARGCRACRDILIPNSGLQFFKLQAVQRR